MKHLFRSLLLWSAVLLLILPGSLLAQGGESYTEGIDVVRLEGHNLAATRVEIHATKHVDGQSAQSEVHLVANFGGDPLWKIRYSVDSTFSVPLDPDWLEVSGDLGWAGLDAEVSVPVQVTTYVDLVGGSFTTSTIMTPVRIHISGLANQGVTQNGGEFRRNAIFTGTVTIGGRSFAYNVYGYNFADQYIPEE